MSPPLMANPSSGESHPVTPIDLNKGKCVAIYSVDAKPLQVESLSIRVTVECAMQTLKRGLVATALLFSPLVQAEVQDQLTAFFVQQLAGL